MTPRTTPRTPRLMGFRSESAIATILDSAKSLDLAEQRAMRDGQDPDAAVVRAWQRHWQVIQDEYAGLPEASARVVHRRVQQAMADRRPQR